MIHFRGWLLSETFRYQITSWTVMSTDQTTLYGFIGYQFDKKFNLYAGTNGIGGSRSLYGSHPFWLANDRVMADELFRGGFTNGVWVNGEVVPGLWLQRDRRRRSALTTTSCRTTTVRRRSISNVRRRAR